MTKTDVVNRAITLYEFIDSEQAGGAEIVLRKDGREYLMMLL